MSGIADRIQEFTRPTGEETLMAVNYPTPRVRIGVKEALVVAAILLVALVAWLVLRNGGEESQAPDEVLAAVTGDAVPEPVPESATSPLATDSATDATAAAATTAVPEVVVSVVGAVVHPGLVTLPDGARVADALATAQPLPGAQLIALNQAQRLTDGEQLYVPAEGEEISPPVALPPAGDGDDDAAQLISLNEAEAAELTQLSGVGEKTAAAIISHREQLGGFTDVEQLLEVKGIGPAKFADLVDQVSL